MAVEEHHLHLFSPQLLINRELSNFADSQSPAMIGNTQTGASPPLAAGKKRPRDHLSLLGEDLSSHFNHQMIDLDHLLLHHAERMREDLMERRRRFSRQLITTIEESVAKRLKAKEEEIERMKKMNWALEDRIRTLCVENEIWKELAQTNEATANLLRTNLEQVLTAQIRVKQEQSLCDEAAAAADDAESCCCGGFDDRNRSPAAVRGCRSCGEREASVLILPCRHLCLCAVCAPMTDSCPICYGANTGTVNVNLS